MPGNHEYQTAGAAGYFDYFRRIGAQHGARGQGWYSFTVGSWLIIGLNSSDGCRPVSCAAGSPQHNFLRAVLAANTRNCVMAYMHHPVASNDMAGRGRPLWELLYGAGVDFVLVGHTHSYRAPGHSTRTAIPTPTAPARPSSAPAARAAAAMGCSR